MSDGLTETVRPRRTCSACPRDPVQGTGGHDDHLDHLIGPTAGGTSSSPSDAVASISEASAAFREAADPCVRFSRCSVNPHVSTLDATEWIDPRSSRRHRPRSMATASNRPSRSAYASACRSPSDRRSAAASATTPSVVVRCRRSRTRSPRAVDRTLRSNAPPTLDRVRIDGVPRTSSPDRRSSRSAGAVRSARQPSRRRRAEYESRMPDHGSHRLDSVQQPRARPSATARRRPARSARHRAVRHRTAARATRGPPGCLRRRAGHRHLSPSP